MRQKTEALYINNKGSVSYQQSLCLSYTEAPFFFVLTKLSFYCFKSKFILE